MILTLFIFLFVFSLFLLWFGYQYEAEIFQILSLFFIFVLGIVLMSAQLTYESGVNETTCDIYETYQYGNNFTGYHWDYDTGTAPDGPQVDAYLFHKNTTVEDCVATTTIVYSTVEDTWSLWFGRFIALGAALGIIYWFVSLKKRKVSG